MLEKWGALECKLGGQSAASGTAAMGSEFSRTGSGSDMILSGEKVVGSDSDMPAKNICVAAVENFVCGISSSGSDVVKFESMCSDIYISRACV